MTASRFVLEIHYEVLIDLWLTRTQPNKGLRAGGDL